VTEAAESEHRPGVVKKFLYLNRRAPHGTVYALESLETVLVGAAFEQDVSVVFMDDGVFQLVKDQDPGGLESKNFSKTYRALEMYDVEKLYVEQDSLRQRGLNAKDLLVPVEIINAETLGALMAQQDVILSF